MKVTVLEASHWHFPLYEEALRSAPNVAVSAISDVTGERGPKLAKYLGAKASRDWREVLDKPRPDFVFAFGRHCDMHEIASLLIERGIPFAIEKPAGINAAEVSHLRATAEKKMLFVAIPLVFGFSELRSTIEGLNPGTEDPWQHMAFRFIAGPVDRYIANHSSWMLDPRQAGGGCVINLAVHFIDLIMHLTGAEISEVSARMLYELDIADVEIYGQLSLTTSKGQICTIETGYTFPGGADEPREFTFSMASTRHYIRAHGFGLRHTARGQASKDIAVELNTDRHYANFVTSTLKDFEAGRLPYAGLDRLERIMNVIDCAYESERQGGAPISVQRIRARTAGEKQTINHGADRHVSDKPLL